MSFTILGIAEKRSDEVVFDAEVVDIRSGEKTDARFSLVYEDGEWRYGFWRWERQD